MGPSPLFSWTWGETLPRLLVRLIARIKIIQKSGAGLTREEKFAIIYSQSQKRTFLETKTKQSQMKKKNTPTIWEAFNEPVMEITEEQAKNVFLASVVIIAAAWVAPHLGTQISDVRNQMAGMGGMGTQYGQVAGMQMADMGMRYGHMAGMGGMGMQYGQVAGIQTMMTAETSELSVPEWYYAAAGTPEAVAESFAAGANEVLDISEPVSELVEFYEPGVEAVWGAWLELMMDPET